MKWLNQFLRLSAEEKKVFIEAAFIMYFSKIYLFLPFRLCIRTLKPAAYFTNPVSVEEITKIRAAIYRANKLACWKNTCLVKSFAARLMLQHRGIGSVMYLGLRIKDGKELVAHAWLCSEGIYVTPKLSSEYKELFKI